MSTRGPGFWGYRWEGYSHEELYDLVNSGVRAAPVTAGQAGARYPQGVRAALAGTATEAATSGYGGAATSARRRPACPPRIGEVHGGRTSPPRGDGNGYHDR